ncbi:MAG: zinc ribbon domain-containing protein [Candidatus Kapaibacterium sp.]
MNQTKYCQSCGFPMKKDKQGGGTEIDGSRSPKYCSMCYQKGAFLTPPEIDSAKKMQTFCIEQMKRGGYNGLVAWLATRSIPRLDRWKKGRVTSDR